MATGDLCIVNKDTPQTVLSMAAVDFVSWDTEREDTPGWFNPAVPTKITVNASGVYVVTLQGHWGSSTGGNDPGGGTRYQHVERVPAGGGNQEILIGLSRPPGGNASTISCAWTGRLSNGDALRVALWQDSGVTLTFGGDNRTAGNPIARSTNAEFGITRII